MEAYGVFQSDVNVCPLSEFLFLRKQLMQCAILWNALYTIIQINDSVLFGLELHRTSVNCSIQTSEN